MRSLSAASLWTILRVDGNFRWYLIGRWLQSIVVIPSAFVTVYAVKRFNADPALLGLLTGSLMVTQMVANPLMGIPGHRWGHRQAMIVGTVAAVIVPIVALQAPTVGWLFVIFVCTRHAAVSASGSSASPLRSNSAVGKRIVRPTWAWLTP